MLIAHVSDTHLGAIPNGITSRARDVYEAFKETVDVALKEHVDIYIHTGDFFNTANPPPEAYVVAYRCLKKLKDRGVKVVAIAGQHDLPKRYSMSPISILKDVSVIDYVAVNDIVSTEIEAKGKRIYFVCVPYGLRHKIPHISVPMEKHSVIMAHLLLKELGIPSAEADISLDLFPSGFNYIALGDYHIKTILKHRSGTLAVYPGSTEVHKVNEYGGKYIALVDLSGDEARVEFVEIQSVRPWIIMSCNELSKCLNDVTDNAKKLISNGKKKPLAYVIIEKIRADVLSRYLDEIVLKGLIEHYILTSQDSEHKEVESSYSFTEKLEHIDLAKMLTTLVEDERLATYLLGLIENPSKQMAEELIGYLKPNIGNIKDLETKIKSKLGRLHTYNTADGKTS